MTVKIRLARRGCKRKPFYRIVVADSRYSRDGRFLEIVGTHDPMRDPAKTEFKNDKVIAWLKKGATATTTVKSLPKKAGITAVEAPAVQ